MTPRSLPLALASGFGLLMLLVAAANPVSAQNDEGENGFARVDIDVIGGVPWEDGRPVDARVRVETERAVSGTLSVVDTPDGRASTTYEFNIDLAAGSSATFPVTLTTGWQGVKADAAIRSNGDVVADDDIEQFGDRGDDVGLVGALGIDEPPQRIEELGTEHQLTVLPLDGRLRGLERLSSLIAPPAAINGLGSGSDEALRVDAWIRGGGQLVVDGPVASLGDSYHRSPTANPARFGVGSGSVVYLEEWEDGIPLGGYLGVGGLRELVESQDLGAGASGELAILAGVALPAVAVVAGVLVLYSVLAGPVVFGLLTARRSQRRIWTVLPALSLLFAAGILGFGFASRSGRSEAHITIVEVNGQGSRATSNLLLTSSFGGNRTLETPAGWSYLGQGRTNGQRPALLRVGATSTEVSLDMPPGSNAVARLSGVTPQFDGALTIDDIRLSGTEVSAQVTNTGSGDLTDAVAFLGNARAEIGLLPSGQAVPFSVDLADHTARTMTELLIWPRVGRHWAEAGPVAVPRDRDATTAAGAWTEWRVAQGTTAIPENILGVAAWSDELAGPLLGVDSGRTVLFARTDVSEVRREVDYRTAARLPSHQQPIFEGDFAGYIEDYRVTLGPDTDLERLAVAVTTNSSALSVLTEDGWRFVDLPGNGEAEYRIPASAVIDGEISLRSHVPEWVWGAGATAAVVVDPSSAGPMSLTDERRFRNAGGPEFAERAEFEARAAPFRDDVPRDLNEELSTTLDGLPLNEDHVESGDVAPGSHHAFVVELEQDQLLVATLSSPSGDSYLELVTSEGELVVSNDDYGQGVDSRIRYEAEEAGLYEIRAMELGSGSLSYQLTLVVEE